MTQFMFVGEFVEVINRTTDQPYENDLLFKVAQNFPKDINRWDHDFFPVRIWQGATDCLLSILKEGDKVAIKGRLEKKDDTIFLVAESYEVLVRAPRKP